MVLRFFYTLVGVLGVLAYGAAETRGMIFGGTDAPPSAKQGIASGGQSGLRGRGGGGFFFIGGGK
ncbi:MAG: hypothetical protein H6729_10305 [Deltaproteobacteria bacterium]|nr:hypothetical protein [Deltaproteobacteria bacterium]